MKEGNSATRYAVEFTGNGSEYFRIWIVNVVLTVVTFYIYSAWAKVRTKRYFYGNTLIDNSSFEYHAKPLQILKGRLIAVALLIIVSVLSAVSSFIYEIALFLLFAFTPWAVWGSIKFNSAMSSYRNVRFRYTSDSSPVYTILFMVPLIPLALFGLVAAFVFFTINPLAGMAILVAGLFSSQIMWPLMQKMLMSNIINHSHFGISKFSAELRARRYYQVYFLAIIFAIIFALLLTIVPLAVLLTYGFSSGAITPEALLDNPDLEVLIESLGPQGAILLAIIGTAGYLAVLTFFVAFIKAQLRNYVFNNAVLDKQIRLESNIATRSYWWLLFSNLGIIILTLCLGIPWTKVRSARYLAKHTAIYSKQPLDNFVSVQAEKVSTLGEEFGDAFDLELDLAI